MIYKINILIKLSSQLLHHLCCYGTNIFSFSEYTLSKIKKYIDRTELPGFVRLDHRNIIQGKASCAFVLCQVIKLACRLQPLQIKEKWNPKKKESLADFI